MKRHLRWQIRAVAVAPWMAAALCAAPAHADELPAVPADRASESWRISLGATYSSGTYGGTARTRVATAPLTLRYSRARFSLRVSVPFVHLTGPGSLIDTQGGAGDGEDGAVAGSGSGENESAELEEADGSGGEDEGSCIPGEEEEADQPCPAQAAAVALAAGAPRMRNGIGDVAISAGYALPLGDAAMLDLAARAKLPTASRAKGFGTGRTDLTLSATLSRDLGPASLWIGARRRFSGKVAGLVERDVWGAGGGASVKVARALVLGADVDWQQSAMRRTPLGEVTGWISLGLSPRLRLNAYAGTGITARSAGFLGGMSVAWRL